MVLGLGKLRKLRNYTKKAYERVLGRRKTKKNNQQVIEQPSNQPSNQPITTTIDESITLNRCFEKLEDDALLKIYNNINDLLTDIGDKNNTNYTFDYDYISELLDKLIYDDSLINIFY